MNRKLLTFTAGLLLLVAGCVPSETPDSQRTRVSVPFDPAARVAHERLSGVPILDAGLESLVQIANTDQDFERRLAEMLNRRIELVEMYRNDAPDGGDPVLETQFAYAADDLFEAMFVAELRRLRVASSGQVERTVLLRLSESLRRIQLDPLWNDQIRPRIQARIDEVATSG